MLIPNQIIETKWHPRNKKHLESKGYKYTHTGNIVFVKLEDMMIGSKCRVKVICDYCGREYTKTYKDWFKNRANNEKDCCSKCHGKAKEINQTKYGGNSPSNSPIIIEKIKKSVKNKYGVEWPSQSQEVKEKVKKTCLERYGFDSANKSPIVKEKLKRTFNKKYGGNSSQCDPKIREKTLKTRMRNGNIPISIPEEKMVNQLKEIYGENNCIPQFILDKISFDCLVIVEGIKIDVEYDGAFWHKDKTKDRRRDYYTIGKGYKVLRFKGNYLPPTKEQIKEGISYLINTKHHVKIIELDI